MFLSRGGQGAVTSSRILAVALVKEGLYAQAIPEFGAERRGAIVRTYIRASTEPIKTHEMVKEPNLLVIFSKGIIDSLGDGIKELYKIPESIINTQFPIKFWRKTYIVNATEIALKLNLVIAGWPVVSTALLGSISRVTGLYKLSTLEEALKEFFRGSILEKNIEAARLAYESTREVI
jgi:pyruvate ferredoxin oxidoreductase gamma subunit